MAIIRKTPWTHQPPLATGIDYNNPLSRDLYSAININGRARDAVRSHMMTVNGNPIPENMPLPTRYNFAGRGLSFDGTGDYLQSPGTAADYEVLGSSFRFAITIIHEHSDGTNLRFYGGYDDSGRFTVMAAGSGRVSFQASSTALFTGFFKYTAGETYITTVVNRPSGQEIWQNGILLSSDTVDNTPFVGGTADNLFITVGATWGGTAEYDANISLVLSHRYNLVPSQIKSLHANPWQVFAPQSTIIPSFVSGGSNTTVSVPAGPIR